MADIQDLLREVQFRYGSVELFCARLRAATDEPTLELPAIALPASIKSATPESVKLQILFMAGTPWLLSETHYKTRRHRPVSVPANRNRDRAREFPQAEHPGKEFSWEPF